MLTLSVVVPATDEPPTLHHCTAALAAATRRGDEVIIIDRPAELSASAARNAGAARAIGDVLVFVDADVEVHPNALDRIRAVFTADPGLAAVFGSYDDAPGAPGVVSVFRNLLHHHVHHHSAGPAETFWTGLGAIRRDVFTATGGFDARRFPHPSVEDIDLGMRVRAGGGRIILDPAIMGTHLKRWTLRSMVATDFARRGTPWVAMQVRRRRLSGALNLGPRHQASAAAVVVLTASALARKPSAGLAAAGALLALNRSFYALLVRRTGVSRAAVGVGLHALHHATAVASVPGGVVAGLRARQEAA